MDINNEDFIITAEVELNKQARKMELDFTKPSDYALGWRHCIDWIQKYEAALQPSTLPLIEKDWFDKWQKFRTDAISKMFNCVDKTTGIYPTSYFFEMLDDYVKNLVKSVPLIDKGSDAVDFLLWMTDDMFINHNDENPKEQAQIHYNNFKNKKK